MSISPANSTPSIALDRQTLAEARKRYINLTLTDKEKVIESLKKASSDLQESAISLKQKAINTISMLATMVVSGVFLFEASLFLIAPAALVALTIGVIAWKHFNQQAHQASESALQKTQMIDEYKALDTPQQITIETATKEYQVSGYRQISFSWQGAQRIKFTYDKWATTEEVVVEEGQALDFSSKRLQPGDRLEFNIQTLDGSYLRPYQDDFIIYAN